MKSNPRLFLWLLLAFVGWLNYEAWQKDYGAGAPPARAADARGPATPAREAPTLDAAIPKAASPTPAGADPQADTSAPAPVQSAGPGLQPASPKIRVRTDVLDMDIGLVGGELQRADLLRYPKVKGGSEPVRLLNRDGPETLYVLQSGLTGPEGSEHPTHLQTFAAA
jgi:YidC/Oxa1 family membrane protein insertase